ncbi:MAG: hypothetical protein H7844_14345 [Nitrospirae bacterium YQR-1]
MRVVVYGTIDSKSVRNKDGKDYPQFSFVVQGTEKYPSQTINIEGEAPLAYGEKCYLVLDQSLVDGTKFEKKFTSFISYRFIEVFNPVAVNSLDTFDEFGVGGNGSKKKKELV